MGNCSLKGVSAVEGIDSIRIMTDSGQILHFEGPKFVGEVLVEFPGYGIFRKVHMSSPLLDHEQLVRGQSYYLLPLGESMLARDSENALGLNKGKFVKEAEPVRMSTSAVNESAVEVLPPPRKGVWRVKLVIDTKQLGEILSEEVNTEALIEQMRLAANSASAVPKRTKINWAQWGLNWKPVLVNLFNQRSPDANEFILAT
ncbi:Dihydroxy-acid dehydratase [Actinidia chinensis var. chinensis]|uniref:Dihydroxy-acid dehydratase n=1 Tax=Actinidia chinensis var. chinensis TaxID=1590841 RepID=A0A2R6QMZ1_ACTCC|nr:Dihydroxy-acid dehydratase [Actinidia chinensis var. chinensis]